MLSLRLTSLLATGSFAAALPMLPLGGGLRGDLKHLGGGEAELAATHLSLGPTPLAGHRPAPPVARPPAADDPLALTLGPPKRPAQDRIGPARWRRKAEPEAVGPVLTLGRPAVHEPLGLAGSQDPLPQSLASPSSRPVHSTFTGASATVRHSPATRPATPHGEGPSNPFLNFYGGLAHVNSHGQIRFLRKYADESNAEHEARIMSMARSKHEEWLAGKASFEEATNGLRYRPYLRAFTDVHMAHEVNHFKGDEQLSTALKATLSPHTGLVNGRLLRGLRNKPDFSEHMDVTVPPKFTDISGKSDRHGIDWRLQRMKAGQSILPFKSSSSAAVGKAPQQAESSAST